MSWTDWRHGPGNRRAWLGLVLSATMLFNLTGCSGGGPQKVTGTVSGTVKCDGEPVSKGVVALQSSKPGLAGARAKLTDGGNFKIDAPVEVGEYVVTVMPPEPAGAVDRPDPKDGERIPENYRTPAKSDLKATIVKGDNKLNLEMKKK